MSESATPPAAPGSDVGLRCPNCSHRHFRVVYTRASEGGRVVRRRECRQCGTRITTWEQAVSR